MFIKSSTELRYVVLWLARKLGRIHHWLVSGWRPLLLWFAVVAFGIWLAEWLAIHLNLFNLKAGTWFQVWNILAIYALTGLLWYVWQARKRVVVEEFVDYTGNPSDSSKLIAKGLATQIVMRLAQLRELYQAVDEQRAIPTNAGVNLSLDATINVEDVSGFLKGAISPESKLSLGPIALPVGNLITLFSRFLQGTRIIGSLHRDHVNGRDILVLIVQRVGGRQSYSWRVESTITVPAKEKEGEQEKYRFDEMITELAYRIFADLELKGTVRWKAVSAFSEGLRAYRDCLHTPKDRKLNLKQAERKLIEALAEDGRFDLAYYNLGVVYSELKKIQAAEQTFLEAIEQNPRVWRSYYALTVNRSQDEYESVESVIPFCDRVIALKPSAADMAKAYHSKGLALRRLNDLQGAIKNQKEAVFHAWKALCVVELLKRSADEAEMSLLPQLEKIASVCLADLAVAYGYQAKQYDEQAYNNVGLRRWFAVVQRLLAFRRAKALFRQALFLDRSNASYYFELGKLCYEWEKYDQAIKAYQCGVQIYPEKVEFWAYLALAYAAQKNEEAALIVCKKVLDHASESTGQVLQETAKAYRLLGRGDQGERVMEIKIFLERLKEDVEKGEMAVPSLKNKLRHYRSKDREWEYALILSTLGQIYLDSDQSRVAEKCFQRALEKLEGSHPQEIRLQRLPALLVSSLIDQGRYDEAWQEAEKALSLDPLNSFGREVLGNVYFALNEFELALDAWQEALLQRPDDTNIYLRIGIAYFQLAQHCHDFSRRETAYQQAIKYLRHVLDLCESNQQAQKGLVCYFLGSLQLEWGAYEEAMSYFRISKTLGFSRLTSTFYLGYAYLKNKEYDACVEQFQSLRIELEAASKAGRSNSVSGENKSKEQWSPDEILVMAYWGLAFSYAERDVALEEARRLIQTALDLMEELGEDKVAEFHYPASCLDCKGWILAKLGEIDEAIDCLEQALILATGAETYLHLAMAYTRKLQDSKDDTQLEYLSSQVKVYCQHVRDLDLNGEFEQRVQALLQGLNERDRRGQQENAREQNSK